MQTTVQQILLQGTREEKLALFLFESTHDTDFVVAKFNLWGRYFFPKFFSSEDADFHREIDIYNVSVYRGLIKSFTDIAFRGAAKTTRTKLFFAFCIANDKEKKRKYMKILSEDGTNSKQSVTDIYNFMIDPHLHVFYPEIFEKTQSKREETMESFTTSTGIKLKAGTVGTSQRGQIQEESRPDFVWFDDFETRMTLKSAVRSNSIWENMDEARNGLAQGGGCIYTCNYLSERGNVHKLVEKTDDQNIVLIVPIIRDGIVAWNRYTIQDVLQFEKDALDFAGDYLCEPSKSKDVMFDREKIDKMIKRKAIKEVSGFRIYAKYDPSHRYASGHDLGGGVGLDSSTSVFIDFDTMPAQVVACFDDNEIKPDTMGDEINREGEMFGNCLVAPENNKFDMAIGRLKQIYPEDKIYRTRRKDTKIDDGDKGDYGWNTNGLTKPKMIFAFCKAVNDGLLELNDPKLIAEARKYTRNDLMDSEVDPRLTTRHFDLLTAGCIAWQMKDFATVQKIDKPYVPIQDTPTYSDIGI